MKNLMIAAATIVALTSAAAAQQNQTPAAPKAGTTQNSDEAQKSTTGQSSVNSAPGQGNGSGIDSKKNEPQAVPPANTSSGGAK